jgi:hypothetical protein
MGPSGTQVDPGQALPLPVAMPIEYEDYYLGAAGSLVNLDILGLVQGSADFAMTRRLVKVEDPDSASTLDASLLTFALSNPMASAAVDFGITIGDADGGSGTIGLAVVAPQATTDTRRWMAVNSRDLAMSLNLAGLVTRDGEQR